MPEALIAPTPVRHPLDPEPVACTKATAVLVLGVVALLTGPLVGGLVPGAVALLLAHQARADLASARGFLTGGDRVRTGEILALIGIGFGIVTLVVGATAAMISMANADGLHDFPDNID